MELSQSGKEVIDEHFRKAVVEDSYGWSKKDLFIMAHTMSLILAASEAGHYGELRQYFSEAQKETNGIPN